MAAALALEFMATLVRIRCCRVWGRSARAGRVLCICPANQPATTVILRTMCCQVSARAHGLPDFVAQPGGTASKHAAGALLHRSMKAVSLQVLQPYTKPGCPPAARPWGTSACRCTSNLQADLHQCSTR